MTVSHIGSNIYLGLSTDTKPTNVPTGGVFLTIDTRRFYIFNVTWSELESSGGGGGGSSGGFEAGGSISFSGNSLTKVFNIPHGLGTTPGIYFAQPKSVDALGDYTTTVTSTNIVITYSIAPPTGSSNLTFVWGAGSVSGVGLLPLSYDFIIYKSGSNYFLKDGVSGVVVENTSNARIPFETAFATFGNAANTHGRIFVKNGTYPISQTGGTFAGENVALRVGNDTHPTNNVEIVGETAGGVILQNTTTPTAAEHIFVSSRCRATWRNLVFDGNNLGDATHLMHLFSSHQLTANRINIYDCRFTNNYGFQAFVGTNMEGIRVERCMFDNPHTVHDQMAFGHLPGTGNYAEISSCYFDRTNLGSNLTTGTANNVDIHDNICKKVHGLGGGTITIEGWGNYNNVNIHHNFCKGGDIWIGPGGEFVSDWTFREIVVSDNTLTDCGIFAQGRPTGGFANSIKGLLICNNNFYDGYHYFLRLDKIQGPLTIIGNYFRDSNTNNFGADGQQILATEVNNFIIKNNDFRMILTSPANVNEAAVGTFNCTNGLIEHNNINNATAKTAIISYGGDTNVIKRFNSGNGPGVITESWGATSVADGGTIAHGLGVTPLVITVSGAIAGEMLAVTAKDSTNFTVAIKTHGGLAGTTQNVNWRATA